LTKYMVGLDGKTAYERLFGKKSREEHLEFGEVVLWRKPRGQETNVIAEARWESGAWLGRRWGTRNHLISYGNRVVERRATARPETGPVEARRGGRDPRDPVAEPRGGRGC
jgi:hypothetical protein